MMTPIVGLVRSWLHNRLQKLRTLGDQWLSYKLSDIWTLQRNALAEPNHQSEGPINFEKPSRGSPANQPSRDISSGN